MASGNTLLQEQYTGIQASSTWGSQMVFGAGAAGALPGVGGSTGGVPDNAAVANSGNPAQSQMDYGTNAGKRPAHNQAVFWAAVAVAVGIWGLAHFAHYHVRHG